MNFYSKSSKEYSDILTKKNAKISQKIGSFRSNNKKI